MWPDRVSNPGPLTYESDALPTALRGPAIKTAELLSLKVYLFMLDSNQLNCMDTLSRAVTLLFSNLLCF